jgi:Sec-independent protein secretion pathway component TatC
VVAPLTHLHIKLMVLDAITPFMLSIKLAFYAGIVLSFPFLLYFAADFVLPALTRKERRLLIPGVLVGFVAQGIGTFRVGGLAIPLSAAPSTRPLGSTGDVSIHLL